MVNRVILIGNLGADPEVRTLESGAMVAKLRIATNESYRDKKGEWQTQTEWHDVILWRDMAERAETRLKKGDAVYIEGKLTHRTWQDKDGNNRYTTEVVASYFRAIGKNERSDNEDTQLKRSQMGPESLAANMPQEGEDDDSLPF